MKRKIMISLLIALSILSTGCRKSEVANTNSSEKQVGSASSQNTSSDTSNATTTKDAKTVTDTKPATSVKLEDYSVYSGDWAQEINVKNDYLYGIGVNINVDKAGNLKGTVGDTTENASHVAGIEIKGKIENGKFSGSFDYDGWGHKGTVNMEFGQNTIKLTLKYGEGSSKDNSWGIGEGTFTLIKRYSNIIRTLNNLEDGGLQVIENQCFSVKLENFGLVKFISGLKRENSSEIATFYLLDNNNNVLYKFPDYFGNSKGRFTEIKAVAFSDVNKDGLKDIIVIGNFTIAGKSDTISSIYLQKGKIFGNNPSFDEKLNKSGSNKDIASIVKYAKDNLK